MTAHTRPWSATLPITHQPLSTSFLLRLVVFGVLMATLGTVSLQAAAQTLDPALVDQFLKSGGTNAQTSGTNDEGRDLSRGDANTIAPTLTPEELELRSAIARDQLSTLRQPTPIEESYRKRLSNQKLEQFGYDLFRNSQPGEPVTGRVDDSYVLGVGDELVIVFQGPTSRSSTVRVDRAGTVNIQDFPPISALGRTLGQVRNEIEGSTRRVMIGTEAYVSLGGVRSIAVTVAGEVLRPGQYRMTALSDAVSALSRAGGIRRSGTLRALRIERAGRVIPLDLYGLLGIGTSGQVKLQDGDRIIVPALGTTFAVSGAVVRPGIYELRPGATVSLDDALRIAGGELVPGGSNASAQRVRASQGAFATVSLRPRDPVLAGDAISVVPSYSQTRGVVELLGHTDAAGLRALTEARTLAQLLVSIDALKTDTYTPFAILMRRDPQTTTPYLDGASLVSVFSKGSDVPLRSDDRIILLSSTDISFLHSPAVRSVVLGPRQPQYQCNSLNRLARAAGDSEGERFAAVNRAFVPFVQKLAGEAPEKSALSPSRRNAAADQRASRAESNDIRGRVRLEEETEEVQEFSAQDLDPSVCPQMFERFPDILPFLIEQSVPVTGDVRRPGPYPVAGSIPVQQLVAVAGGRASRRDDDLLEIVQTAEEQNGRLAKKVKWVEGGNLLVTPFDSVRLISAGSGFESGAVLLSGEFAQPGIYPIRKGEKLSELIKRAGGVTSQSFPYGAVFTRASVRTAQREGLQRALKELNTGLLSIAARKDISADAIVAAQELSQSIAGTEPPGRVVVEADPRVLELRPDLDTVLEPGDTVFMPKRPNFVLTLGDVLNPTALQFSSRKSVKDYLGESGGVQSTADDERIFIVYPNGIAEPVKTSFWGKSQQILPPGSAIVVPKNIDPLYKLTIASTITQIVSQVASALATVVILAR